MYIYIYNVCIYIYIIYAILCPPRDKETGDKKRTSRTCAFDCFSEKTFGKQR